jgi:hypothetical protein
MIANQIFRRRVERGQAQATQQKERKRVPERVVSVVH